MRCDDCKARLASRVGIAALSYHVPAARRRPNSGCKLGRVLLRLTTDFRRASADAAAILRGEWWRTVTALTLHADAGHAVGNAVLGGVLLALLAQMLGAGSAGLLVLGAGVLGTFGAAVLVRRDFVSIGASTAVFGALGALAALPQRRRRAWIPLGGGLALLAFLGAGKRADFAGHLCGFAAGLALGALAGLWPPPRHRLAQAALSSVALLVPLAAWLAAFR